MKTSLLCATLLATTMSMSASAELIHSDWNAEGDGLTTIDTSSGLEFLKFSGTLGHSIDGVKSEFDNKYSGWRFATNEEVYSFMESALPGIDLSSVSSELNQRLVLDGLFQDFTEFMSVVGNGDSPYLYAYGFTYNELGNNALTGIFQTMRSNSTTVFVEYISSSYTDSYKYALTGVWLVRDTDSSLLADVPTPFALSSLALLCFGAIRRRETDL